MKKGIIFIISAPSGAGKTSLVNALLQRSTNIQISISHTTRTPRPLEKDGTHYHFVDTETFQDLMQKNAFLEYAEVFGNYYGTSFFEVEHKINQGIDVILEIDWQGAEQVRKKYPKAISIFILPPSYEALKERLIQRGQDHPDVINRRLNEAEQEISHCAEYDFILVNHVFEETVSQLMTIIQACHFKTPFAYEEHRQFFSGLL